jgi:cbb3-type cytochrome oxidase maturation protein
MSVVIVLILASLAVALMFLGAFIWAVGSGQYEDTLTPAMRVLAEEGEAEISKKPGNGAVPCPASTLKTADPK